MDDGTFQLSIIPNRIHSNHMLAFRVRIVRLVEEVEILWDGDVRPVSCQIPFDRPSIHVTDQRLVGTLVLFELTQHECLFSVSDHHLVCHRHDSRDISRLVFVVGCGVEPVSVASSLFSGLRTLPVAVR